MARHPTAPKWGEQFPFVGNHGHVLLAIAANPDARVRDLAETVGVTQRTITILVSDLEDAGYLTRRAVGRRTTYEVHGDVPLVDAHLGHHTVGELLDALAHRTELVDATPAGRKVAHNLPCAFCGRDTTAAGPGVYVEVEVTDPYASGADGRRLLGAHIGCLRAVAPSFDLPRNQRRERNR